MQALARLGRWKAAECLTKQAPSELEPGICGNTLRNLLLASGTPGNEEGDAPSYRSKN